MNDIDLSRRHWLAGLPESQRREVDRLAGLCVSNDNADLVIVGGAGLAGLAGGSLAGHPGIIMLDSAFSALCIAREQAQAVHGTTNRERSS